MISVRVLAGSFAFRHGLDLINSASMAALRMVRRNPTIPRIELGA